MAKTMKAAVVREFGKPLVIQEMAIPEPGPEEIQITVSVIPICTLQRATGPSSPPPRSSPATRA
jgi:propanol-preferring alcohol dehydrogenase